MPLRDCLRRPESSVVERCLEKSREREREVTVVGIAVHLTYHPHAISLGKDQNNPILVPITPDTLILTESKQHSRGFSIYINNGSSKSGRPSAMGKIQKEFELCP